MDYVSCEGMTDQALISHAIMFSVSIIGVIRLSQRSLSEFSRFFCIRNLFPNPPLSMISVMLHSISESRYDALAIFDILIFV